eukprot:jgi/Picre1/31572/NNA_006924.t1
MSRVRLFATVPARHKRNQQGMKNQKALPLKNDQITARELRVVFPEVDPLGTKILPLEEAKKRSKPAWAGSGSSITPVRPTRSTHRIVGKAGIYHETETKSAGTSSEGE